VSESGPSTFLIERTETFDVAAQVNVAAGAALQRPFAKEALWPPPPSGGRINQR